MEGPSPTEHSAGIARCAVRHPGCCVSAVFSASGDEPCGPATGSATPAPQTPPPPLATPPDCLAAVPAVRPRLHRLCHHGHGRRGGRGVWPAGGRGAWRAGAGHSHAGCARGHPGQHPVSSCAPGARPARWLRATTRARGPCLPHVLRRVATLHLHVPAWRWRLQQA